MVLISELEQILKSAKEAGCQKVKIFNKDSSSMSGMIADCGSYQIRAVQQYGVNGDDSRNKFLLLSSTPLDAMGAR